MAPDKKDCVSKGLDETMAPDKEDCICPICLCIFIEPVTMPCKHSLCMPCYKQTVEKANLCCPICRLRISVWTRRASKMNCLVDKVKWEMIKKAFPEEVQNRLEGNESQDDVADDSDNFDAIQRRLKDLSKPGEIRQEYEAALQKLQYELEEAAKSEEEASVALIKALQQQEEEEREMLGIQRVELDKMDREIAEELQNSEPGIDYTKLVEPDTSLKSVSPSIVYNKVQTKTATSGIKKGKQKQMKRTGSNTLTLTTFFSPVHRGGDALLSHSDFQCQKELSSVDSCSSDSHQSCCTYIPDKCSQVCSSYPLTSRERNCFVEIYCCNTHSEKSLVSQRPLQTTVSLELENNAAVFDNAEQPDFKDKYTACQSGAGTFSRANNTLATSCTERAKTQTTAASFSDKTTHLLDEASHAGPIHAMGQFRPIIKCTQILPEQSLEVVVVDSQPVMTEVEYSIVIAGKKQRKDELICDLSDSNVLKDKDNTKNEYLERRNTESGTLGENNSVSGTLGKNNSESGTLGKNNSESETLGENNNESGTLGKNNSEHEKLKSNNYRKGKIISNNFGKGMMESSNFEKRKTKRNTSKVDWMDSCDAVTGLMDNSGEPSVTSCDKHLDISICDHSGRDRTQDNDGHSVTKSEHSGSDRTQDNDGYSITRSGDRCINTLSKPFPNNADKSESISGDCLSRIDLCNGEKENNCVKSGSNQCKEAKNSSKIHNKTSARSKVFKDRNNSRRIQSSKSIRDPSVNRKNTSSNVSIERWCVNSNDKGEDESSLRRLGDKTDMDKTEIHHVNTISDENENVVEKRKHQPEATRGKRKNTREDSRDDVSCSGTKKFRQNNHTEKSGVDPGNVDVLCPQDFDDSEMTQEQKDHMFALQLQEMYAKLDKQRITVDRSKGSKDQYRFRKKRK